MSPGAAVALAWAVGFFTEWAYVGFVRATTEARAAAAALWTAVLVALGWGALALMYALTWYLCLPALAGHSMGTYLAVRDVARRAR